MIEIRLTKDGLKNDDIFQFMNEFEYIKTKKRLNEQKSSEGIAFLITFMLIEQFDGELTLENKK